MDFTRETSSFTISPGFCPDCGTILPFCRETGGVTCYACERKWEPEDGLYFEVNSNTSVKILESRISHA